MTTSIVTLSPLTTHMQSGLAIHGALLATLLELLAH